MLPLGEHLRYVARDLERRPLDPVLSVELLTGERLDITDASVHPLSADYPAHLGSHHHGGGLLLRFDAERRHSLHLAPNPGLHVPDEALNPGPLDRELFPVDEGLHQGRRWQGDKPS